VITCVVDYTIDPRKTAEFERFARAWIGLVTKHGGQHHGYFLEDIRWTMSKLPPIRPS
jgi:NIPSNAP